MKERLEQTPESRSVRDSLKLSSGPLAQLVESHRGTALSAATGLWRKDPSVWSADPAVQKTIANRLGWLGLPASMREETEALTAFANEIRAEGITDVVLLGMGGSSLAPEVLRAIVGSPAGWPRLHMLDSTDPAAVQAVAPPLDRALFIVASKSGGTIEPNSLAAHYRQALVRAGVSNWSRHFVAITDPGTALATQAEADGFRRVFINPADIGGRYSALSLFGLVPAALMGQDVSALLTWGQSMVEASNPNGYQPGTTNPSVDLGLLMGTAAKAGRDKLTLLVPPSLEPFGLWVEQLVAESTGKSGMGVVPIAGEVPADPDAYRHDRVFVYIRPAGQELDVRSGGALDTLVKTLVESGAPVATIDLPSALALGAEFVRWEVATAVAGAILGVNPFDEPNVAQAKEATTRLLGRYIADHRLPSSPPDRARADGVTLTLTSSARHDLARADPEAILTLVKPGDYVAILAYVGPDPELAAALTEWRNAVRDRTGAATMAGLGPRYLHSTGQLHKGGSNTGVFIIVTATPRVDVPIPGQVYSFGTLEMAQALGDFASLDLAKRRAIHVHLPVPDAALVHGVADALMSRIPASRTR